MLSMILGPSGSGKTEYIYSNIKQRLKNCENKMIMLVPEQNSFECEKRLIKLCGASSSEKVEVLSFTRLVNLFESEYGKVHKQEADDSVKLIMMQRAIKSVKHLLGTYTKTCSKIEFAKNMLALATELKQSRITADMLRGASQKIEGSSADKSADIAVILTAYHTLLTEKFADPLDSLGELSVQLEKHQYFKDKTVYIDAFEFFTEQQYEIISKMMTQCKEVYITLCTNPKNRDEYGVFANVNKVVKRLNTMAKSNAIAIASPIVLDTLHRFNHAQLKCVEQLLSGGDSMDCDGESVTVCSCQTAYDECDFIARTIKKLVRTEGYRFKDFVVIARDMNIYDSMLCDALDKYGIAYFSDKRFDTDSLILVRYIFNALDCVCNNYRSEYFLSYIKSPLSGLDSEQAGDLDNYIFTWNKRGRKVTEPFTENPDGADAVFNTKKLEYLNSLRSAATENLIQLEKTVRCGDTPSRCKAIYDFLVQSHIPQKLKDYCLELKNNNEHLLYDITAKSWDVVMASLDTMIQATQEDQLTLKEFAELYKSLLSSKDIGHVPGRIDEVILGSADRIRTTNPKITFIMGANFGEFPRPVGAAGLFTPRDRRRLIESGLKISEYSVSGVIDEKFFVYNALCSATDRLYITYHNSNLKGNISSKSEFVSLLEEKVSGIKIMDQSDSEKDKTESELSALELVLKPEYSKFAQSLDSYFKTSDSIYKGIIAAVFSADGTVSIDAEQAIRLFGKNIDMSASKVETYSKCPFSYFCKYGLKAKPLRSAELDVRQKGSMVHYVLEQLIKKYSSMLNEIEDDQLKEGISLTTDEYLKEHFGEAELTDSFVFMVSRIKSLLFYLLRHIGRELSQSEFKPDKFEAPIGKDAVPQYEIPLDTGCMRLRGSVDRVDIFEKDAVTYVRVVDYKTGSKSFNLSDVMHGLNMQMLIYLFAIVDSPMYTHSKAGGVLYLPSTRAIPPVSRGLSDKRIEEEQNKKIRMNGLVLSNSDVIAAMEKEKQGKYIPVSDNPRSKNSVADEEDFALIKKKVDEVLADIGNRIHSGDIAVSPLDGTDSEACKYCEFKAVCRREANEPHDKIENLKLDEVLKKLKEENGIDTDR